MSRASALAAGRRAAEAGMVDTCTITRVTGTATNPETGNVTQTTATVYSGVCEVKELLAFARDTSPTPPDPALMRYRVLKVPVASSDGIRKGDDVTVTACVNDPELVGKAMRVRDPGAGSWQTSRRVGIEEAV